MKDWICTDPNNEQYGRQISKYVFEFKEKNRFTNFNEEGEFIQLTINLENYTPEQVHQNISPYYNDITDLAINCGEDTAWIIAECIFEQESGLY